jgi:MFS family permease
MRDKIIKMSFMRSYPIQFWILNLLQMIEKLAYWVVLIQMPVYIAQKDAAGGLQWGQTTKGIIFFWWAVVQNLSPLIFGVWADRYGRKKMLFYSMLLIITGYILLGAFRDIYLFISATIILGIGSGMFKPALQGAIASNLNEKNSSTGWGIYFMLLNLAVFFGPVLSKYLKEISWEMVFWGSAAVFALNLVVLLFFTDNTSNTVSKNNSPSIKIVIKNLFEPQVIWFIIIMSGFMIIYMQFYETLPNFLIDWTDTSSLVAYLGLPQFMLMENDRGVMIAYEWFYTLNSLLIIGFVVFVSRLSKGKSRTKVLSLGILLSAIGLFITGSSMVGILTLAGIVIYTFGEMITNPKITEHLGSIAPENSKSMYLSYLNISLAIGLGFGSLLGGFLYGHYGEKARMATKYIKENFEYEGTIEPSQAMILLCEKAGITTTEATELLWQANDPYLVWLPFLFIGIASFVGMIFYSKKWW